MPCRLKRLGRRLLTNEFVVVVAVAMLSGAMVAQATKGLYDETALRVFEVTFQQTDWLAQLTKNYSSKTYIAADLKVDGVTYKNVGVRYRGNSSYASVPGLKKPFKIGMDAFVVGQKLLGHGTLNLNNGFRDPTFVREVLAYHVFRQFMPAPRANFVRLVVNGSNYGVYSNIEQINKDLLSEWFRDDTGNRYRGERQATGGTNDSALTWLGNNANSYKRGYELKNENAVQPWTDILNVCNILNNSAASTLPTALPQVVDVDAILRYLMGQTLLPAIDSYLATVAHNFYLYFDPYHGRMSLLPWDLNASFGGNATLTVVQKQTLSPFYNPNVLGRPLITRLSTQAPWRAQYVAHLRAALDAIYDWKVLGPKVAQYQALIATEVKNDTLKLYSDQLFVDNVTKDVQIPLRTLLQWVPGLQPMVDKRRAFLLANAEIKVTPPNIANLLHSPATPTHLQSVQVTVQRATGSVAIAQMQLWYRSRGAYRQAIMLDDGKSGDGAANDGVYGGAIPSQPFGSLVEYYVLAQADAAAGSAVRFVPEFGAFRPRSYRVSGKATPGLIRINEVLASNANGDRDEANDREDWVELSNPTGAAYDLTGHFLTDDLLQPKKWALPSGTSIPSHGFLRIWCDNEPHEGKLHATFKLDKDGDELGLFDAKSQMVDGLIFGGQQPDRSYGRVPDAHGDFFHIWQPSGGGPVTGWPQNIGTVTEFDGRRNGSSFGLHLQAKGPARIGLAFRLELHGAGPNAAVIVGLSPATLSTNLGGFGTLALHPSALYTLPQRADGNGTVAISTGLPNLLFGFTVYLQALEKDLSNALAVRVSY